MTTATNSVGAAGTPGLAMGGNCPDLDSLSIPHSVLFVVPYEMAIEYFVLPYAVDETGRISALMAYPNEVEVLKAVQLVTNAPLKPTAVPKDIILKLIRKHYGASVERKAGEMSGSGERGVRQRMAFNKTDTTVAVVNDVMHEAIRLRASDIHWEPFEREMRVRFRIDGVLHEMMSIPSDRVAGTSSRVKVMAAMDIAEKRRPQDGKIRVAEHGHDVDVRVSTLPTDFGEKIVMRLLDKRGFDYRVDTVGLEQERLALFKRALELPNGIVVITGPTGSGKTTSLYAAINYIKKPGINISTVEDPIEYNIPGVSQTQVTLATGMTFAASLRTLLRQDPDVIMVGEMRDQETAEIAIRSSLTGHLVLSTLHTNDAPSAITRLTDMGIEPYLVSSSVTLIVAQRLVRAICEHCKCEDVVSKEVKASLGLPESVVLHRGLGCSQCGYTGYRGRTGIFEVLPVSDSLRKLINDKAYTAQIRDAAVKEGLVTLRSHAISALTQGITSLEEVVREISVIA